MVLELQPRRAVLSWSFWGAVGRSGRLACGLGCREAERELEHEGVDVRKAFYREVREKRTGRSEAKDQTSSVDCKMDQVIGGGGRSGTGEMPERCFSSSILDNLVGQEGVRREGRRDVVWADHGFDQHPDFRGAVKQNQQDSVRAWRWECRWMPRTCLRSEPLARLRETQESRRCAQVQSIVPDHLFA